MIQKSIKILKIIEPDLKKMIALTNGIDFVRIRSVDQRNLHLLAKEST